MKFRELVGLFKETFVEWKEDRAPQLGAALAFYSVFSLAPLLMIVISIAGLAFGREAAQGRIVEQLEGLLGANAAASIDAMIQSARKPSSGIVSTVFGVATLLFGASGAFAQLQDALNVIWEAEPRSGDSIWTTIRNRFLSFAMVLGTGFLLLVSLVISAGLAALNDSLGNFLPIAPQLLQIVNFIVSFVVITLMFGVIFKLLPDVRIEWREVWIGAALTSLLFTIGKSLIGLYLGKSGVASAYGAAGSLVVVLIWIYYSAQILLFGAEFTQVHAQRHRSHIQQAASEAELGVA
jgi:membrane protein